MNMTLQHFHLKLLDYGFNKASFFQNILLLIIGGWVFNGHPAQHCILSYGYDQSHLTNYWLQSKCKMLDKWKKINNTMCNIGH